MPTTRRLPATPAESLSSTPLAGLSDAWQRTVRGDTPDWTRFGGALDMLAQRPEMLPDALEPRPKPSGSAVMDALLAGIADKLADAARLPRPAWTKRVPRLKVRVVRARDTGDACGAPGRHASAAEERGFLLDESSLWRDRASVDV